MTSARRTLSVLNTYSLFWPDVTKDAYLQRCVMVGRKELVESYKSMGKLPVREYSPMLLRKYLEKVNGMKRANDIINTLPMDMRFVMEAGSEAIHGCGKDCAHCMPIVVSSCKDLRDPVEMLKRRRSVPEAIAEFARELANEEELAYNAERMGVSLEAHREVTQHMHDALKFPGPARVSTALPPPPTAGTTPPLPQTDVLERDPPYDFPIYLSCPVCFWALPSKRHENMTPEEIEDVERIHDHIIKKHNHICPGEPVMRFCLHCGEEFKLPGEFKNHIENYKCPILRDLSRVTCVWIYRRIARGDVPSFRQIVNCKYPTADDPPVEEWALKFRYDERAFAIERRFGFKSAVTYATKHLKEMTIAIGNVDLFEFVTNENWMNFYATYLPDAYERMMAWNKKMSRFDEHFRSDEESEQACIRAMGFNLDEFDAADRAYVRSKNPLSVWGPPDSSKGDPDYVVLFSNEVSIDQYHDGIKRESVDEIM